MYPHFQPDCYIQNGTQLLRVVKRVDTPGKPEDLKLQVEDAYCYEVVGGERVYARQWLTCKDLKRGGYELQRFIPTELPARFRT